MAPSADHDRIARAARAVSELLRAVSVPVDDDPDLADTPTRVAQMYLDELLDGYRADPTSIARETIATTDEGLVVLTGIRYTSMCPHHLLPSLGRAHVGYLPAGRVAGLGAIVRLVEMHAHRLVLQETLGQRIADAMTEQLGARGVAVMLRARHRCLIARGERQSGAAVTTFSYAGDLRRDGPDREAFVRSIPTGRRSAR